MSVVNTALSYLGCVNYVFGADDVPGGKADCSSFVKYVYGIHGVTLGRTTGTQWTGSGQKIKNMEDLREGDLVFFFGTYASGNVDGVSHVGIYIGSNQFVHCSSGAKNVVVSSLSETYWKNHFLGGLRKTETSTEPIKTETGESTNTSDFGVIGNIVKYVFIVAVIVTGVVSLVLSLGVHKTIIKSIVK